MIEELIEALRYCTVVPNTCIEECPRYHNGLVGNECARRLVSEIADALESSMNENKIVLPVPMNGDIWIIVDTIKKAGCSHETRYLIKSKLTFSNLPRVLNDFGKTIFATREEAARKIKELNEQL